MNTIIQAIAAIVAPLLAGFAAVEVAKFVRATSTWPAWLQQIFGLLVALGISALEQKFPFLTLPPGLAGWTQDAIAVALLAIVKALFPVALALKAARLARGLKS